MSTTTHDVRRAGVGNRDVEGWDHLMTDSDGLITTLVVMVRPLSGLIALAEAMGPGSLPTAADVHPRAGVQGEERSGRRRRGR